MKRSAEQKKEMDFCKKKKKKLHYHGYQVVRSTTLAEHLMTYSQKAAQANLLNVSLEAMS